MSPSKTKSYKSYEVTFTSAAPRYFSNMINSIDKNAIYEWRVMVVVVLGLIPLTPDKMSIVGF